MKKHSSTQFRPIAFKSSLFPPPLPSLLVTHDDKCAFTPLMAVVVAQACAEPTCAVPVVPRPKQSTGLLILPLALPLAFTLVREGVDALVPAGVAVRVVDDHVVRGDGQVNPQLVAGQAALGLGTQRRSQAYRLEPQSRSKSPLGGGSASSGTVWGI